MLAHRTLVLDDNAPIDRRIDAALAMANDAAGAQLLIDLAARNKIAYQLREAIGSVIFSNPDRTVRSAADGFFARPGGRAAHDRRRRCRPPGGDAARGAARFAGACSTCHRSGPGSPGADVGPDLTDIAKKFDRNGLIEAIVQPSAAIAFGFGAEVFVTRSSEPIDRIPSGRGRHHLDPRRLRTRADHPVRRSRRTDAAEVEPDAGSAVAWADRTGRRGYRVVPRKGASLMGRFTRRSFS